ncbi:non-ribosomal peptide synthetase [Paenibacillus humicus]|uniref:non-ribosomal peptide synthetase n=1 Tax=Paenibacillus humicus TaxID=412861 RepID=UPI000FDB5AB0|nr:non-ribosomal peptide synthetase [Paenibacillus humicus]
MNATRMAPAAELDRAAATQVWIIRLDDPAAVARSERLLLKDAGPDFRAAARGWVEHACSREEREERLRRESRRPIGRSAKMRIVLVTCGEGEADLIVAADRESVPAERLLAAGRYLAGESEDYSPGDTGGIRLDAGRQPSWGLPGWDRAGAYPDSHGWILTELDSAAEPSTLAAALLLSLERYGTKNASIYMEENGPGFRKAASGTLDEAGRVLLAEESFDRSARFDAGILDVDLPDHAGEFIPCLAPPLPVTLSAVRSQGVLRSIRIAASESVVHPAVLAQFAEVYRFCLERLLAGAEPPEGGWRSLPLPPQPSPSPVPVLRQRRGQPGELLARIRSVAAAWPHRPAVSDQEGGITYTDLDRRSDLMARRLISYGVKEGTKVIVSLDQTAELVVILVAVVKAGGTYIPVDPGYPAERIRFVIEDSEAELIVTRSEEILSERPVRRVSPEELASAAAEELEGAALPAEAPKEAYVIYTSGTSGQPKGVLVPSANIVSLIEATEGEFKLSEKDVWTMFHSASFDFSVWEMWGCLLTGGHLIVVPRPLAKSPYEFCDLLAAKGVTVLNQTPSAFYALVQADGEQKQARLASVRLVVFGGEALDSRKLSAWQERYPAGRCRLVNMYGITETTVHVTWRTVLQKDPGFLSRSVGVPLKGWEISIREPGGLPCRYGMEGEIWVGGAGVSSGYLNREELTRQRFVTDENGRRWYRSGDHGVMRPDGSIDYLGRMDSQVKIRGFRIELDEIRAVIEQLPQVRNAVVLVHDGEGGEASHKQILAFFEASGQLQADRIRAELKARLPEYMLPARLIRVDGIPLTINGKADHKALLEGLLQPEEREASPAAAEEAGRGADAYLSIWSRVLGHAVGPDDLFFESGGNSLLAVELLSALKKDIDSSLTLRDLYIHSSPSALHQFMSKKILV